MTGVPGGADCPASFRSQETKPNPSSTSQQTTSPRSVKESPEQGLDLGLGVMPLAQVVAAPARATRGGAIVGVLLQHGVDQGRYVGRAVGPQGGSAAAARRGGSPPGSPRSWG